MNLQKEELLKLFQDPEIKEGLKGILSELQEEIPENSEGQADSHCETANEETEQQEVKD